MKCSSIFRSVRFEQLIEKYQKFQFKMKWKLVCILVVLILQSSFGEKNETTTKPSKGKVKVFKNIIKVLTLYRILAPASNHTSVSPTVPTTWTSALTTPASIGKPKSTQSSGQPHLKAGFGCLILTKLAYAVYLKMY